MDRKKNKSVFEGASKSSGDESSGLPSASGILHGMAQFKGKKCIGRRKRKKASDTPNKPVRDNKNMRARKRRGKRCQDESSKGDQFQRKDRPDARYLREDGLIVTLPKRDPVFKEEGLEVNMEDRDFFLKCFDGDNEYDERITCVYLLTTRESKDFYLGCSTRTATSLMSDLSENVHHPFTQVTVVDGFEHGKASRAGAFADYVKRRIWTHLRGCENVGFGSTDFIDFITRHALSLEMNYSHYHMISLKGRTETAEEGIQEGDVEKTREDIENESKVVSSSSNRSDDSEGNSASADKQRPRSIARAFDCVTGEAVCVEDVDSDEKDVDPGDRPMQGPSKTSGLNGLDDNQLPPRRNDRSNMTSPMQGPSKTSGLNGLDDNQLPPGSNDRSNATSNTCSQDVNSDHEFSDKEVDEHLKNLDTPQWGSIKMHDYPTQMAKARLLQSWCVLCSRDIGYRESIEKLIDRNEKDHIGKWCHVDCTDVNKPLTPEVRNTTRLMRHIALQTRRKSQQTAHKSQQTAHKSQQTPPQNVVTPTRTTYRTHPYSREQAVARSTVPSPSIPGGARRNLSSAFEGEENGASELKNSAVASPTMEGDPSGAFQDDKHDTRKQEGKPVSRAPGNFPSVAGSETRDLSGAIELNEVHEQMKGNCTYDLHSCTASTRDMLKVIKQIMGAVTQNHIEFAVSECCKDEKTKLVVKHIVSADYCAVGSGQGCGESN